MINDSNQIYLKYRLTSSIFVACSPNVVAVRDVVSVAVVVFVVDRDQELDHVAHRGGQQL